jgi:predicted acetyltransferase
MSVQVRRLTVADEADYRAGCDELVLDNFQMDELLTPETDWGEHVALLARQEEGLDLPAGRVPAAIRVAVVDGHVAGRVSFRFELNDHLAEWGGHVGYGVRPAFRRRGIATALLLWALRDAYARGLREVLVTCLEENVGSAATIERCGGVFDRHTTKPSTGETLRRYWIPVDAA